MRVVNRNHQNAFDAKQQTGSLSEHDYAFTDFLPISRFASKMSSREQHEVTDGSSASATNSPDAATTVDEGQKTAPPPPPPNPNDIRIELITEEDNAEVLQLLKSFFFKDEPLNTYLDLGECKELEEWSLACIPEKCSFKAVNSKGEMVGVFLNGVVRRSDHENHEPDSGAAACKHPKFKKILTLMEYIESQFDVFKLYPDVDSFLDGKILSVDENYRGCGIAGKLTARAMDYMRDHKISMYHILCSSHYSARVCEKLDFEVVYELRYDDYVVNGECPLLPAEPHVASKILIKRI